MTTMKVQQPKHAVRGSSAAQQASHPAPPGSLVAPASASTAANAFVTTIRGTQLATLEPTLGSAKLQRLHALGLQTLEQLTGMAAVAARELERYLGTSNLDKDVMAQLPIAMQIPADAAVKISAYEYPLGIPVELGPAPMPAEAFAVTFEGPASAAPMPAQVAAPMPAQIAAPGQPGASPQPAPAIPSGPPPAVNHIPTMPPIRDQQKRGTCVSFASLAVYEHFLNANGALQDLSEQFLYFNCKRVDGQPNTSGTWIKFAFDCLFQDGVCLEPTWPYNGNAVAGSEGQGPPPAGALAQALTFRPRTITPIAPAAVDDIRAALRAGNCVAFSVPVYNSWYQSPEVKLTGNITLPIPGEIRVGGHAMCFVGYVDDPSPGLGGGRFLVRNSWNGYWGIECPFGQGYGTIPYSYIARYGMEAYTLG